MSEITDYIDRHFDRFVAELSDWCRQPSVSAQHLGIAEMSKIVVEKMLRIGLQAEIYPVGSGHPFVVGQLVGEKPTTILFYNHYDVQPVEPMSAWVSPPFEPTIRDSKLYARGTSDNKGTLLARLEAVESILKTRGKLPVTVKFLVDGEEEIISPSLPDFVNANHDLLQADVCIWESGQKNVHGQLEIELGNKGILIVELTAQTIKRDYHGQFAPLLPNAGWALIWTLGTIKGRDERVKIEGFYDDVALPSPAELALFSKMSAKDQELREAAGVTSLLGEAIGTEANRRHLGDPNCNISGVETGYNGPGFKTVVPATAQARIDIRLVPNQDPDDIWEKLMKHLDRHALPGVTARRLARGYTSSTPADHWFVDLVADAARSVYSKPPEIHPRMAGFTPRYIISRWNNIPIVGSGVGYAGSGPHAPNEHIRLADFCEGIKHMAEVLIRLGER